MQKNCKQCFAQFEITPEDLRFYDKVSPVFAGKKYIIPAPTLCPDCRQQRRLAFRNERHLYHRKCDLTGKAIISNYRPEAERVIYEQQAWWSDKWDGHIYGRDFDFNRSFFDQFNDLQKQVPQLALSVWNSENSSYCNYVGNVKSCYLVFGSVYSEDCYYGSPYYSKNSLDTLVVRECEYCYECIDSRKLYECFYCQDCHSSNNLLYCFDLQGCKNCIGCTGLRNKEYHVFNKPLSKEEYQNFLQKLNLCDGVTHEYLSTELEKLKKQTPHRFMQSKNVENVSGNYIYQAKNVLDSFYADRCEDCKNCAQVVDLKDCYDNNYTEENELCYDYLGAYQNTKTLFSRFCNKAAECFYCDGCFTSNNLFGCVGLTNSKYCILNKQSSKEEYEKLVPLIIEHMRRTGEWGEFFPMSLSPFGYNESVAQEYFPLTNNQATMLGATWKKEDQLNRYDGPHLSPPQNIKDVQENIIKEILTCKTCHKNYKIIEPELKFYKKMQLPLPVNCPDCRHNHRLSKRNPRKLWQRSCAKCHAPIQTSYAPERPETIYCEACYLKEVY